MNNNQYLYKKLEDAFKSEFSERKNILDDIIRICKETLFDKKDPLIFQYEDMDGVYNAVCDSQKIDRDLLKTKTSKRETVAIRHFFFYLVKGIFGDKYPLKDIAQFLGHPDHSNSIYAINSCKARLETNESVMQDVLIKWMDYNKNKEQD